MATKRSSVTVSLEGPLYRTVERLAKREGLSLSLKARDLIKEALQIEEDVALGVWAEDREKTFQKSSALKHNEVWPD